MKPQLSHTIVNSLDRDAAATFLADVMGFDPPVDLGYFMAVETGNGVQLDFCPADPVLVAGTGVRATGLPTRTG